MKPGHVTQACLCSQTNRAEDCAIHDRTHVKLPAVSGQPQLDLASVYWLFSVHQMQEEVKLDVPLQEHYPVSSRNHWLSGHCTDG